MPTNYRTGSSEPFRMEYCIPKFYGNVASLVLQGTVSRQKSVNLISEEWNHKMVSWVGSVATQSQMEQQTIVQGNTGAIHEPTR